MFGCFVFLLSLCFSLKIETVSAAITRTGSVSEIESTANSGSQSITVPSDATLIVVTVTGYTSGETATRLTSGTLTLAGNSLTAQVVAAAGTTDYDLAGVFYRVNPATGSQTLAWDWNGTATWTDGGHIIYAFYKGVDTASPIKDSDTATQAGASSTATATTPTLTASSGDMIFSGLYAWDTTNPTSITWTNATEVNGNVYNNSWGGAAETFPSGDVAVIADPNGNSGNDLWLALASVVFRSGTSEIEQEGFRWRDDDGSESSASWLQLQDVNIVRAASTTTRLRTLLNATDDPATAQYQLEYKKSTDSTYRKILTANAFPSIASSNTTNGTTLSGGVSLNMPSGVTAGDLL